MNNRSRFTWIGGLLLCAAAFFIGRSFFPGVLKVVLTVAAIGVALIAVVIAFFIIRAIKKSNDPANVARRERDAILSKGRSHLVKLRSMAMSIGDEEVRAVSNEICSSVDLILTTLKEQPENIPAVRQFFNYYLPTMGNILTKFVRVEKSGVPMKDMPANAVSCLRDIKTAMDKQYANLFDDDILDLTVEMDALTLACKRDGLLADDDFGQPAPVNLTL